MNTIRQIKGNSKESFFIRWLQKMTSTSKTHRRPALQGIYINNGNAIVSDGFCMVVTPTPEPLKLQGPAILKGDIPVGDFETEMEVIEYSYPNCATVIPHDDPESIVVVNPKLLKNIMGGLKGAATIAVHGKNKAIEINGTGKFGEQVYALLLPMVSDTQLKIKRPELKEKTNPPE